MKKILTIAALAIGFMSSAAHAATLDITLGPSVTYFYNAGQSIPASNIVLPSGSLDLVNNSQIIPAGVSSTNYWAAPAGITGPNYLAVLGLTYPSNASVDQGEAIFTLAGGQNQFGFTWGTIDTYNTIELSDAGHTYTITGADILSHLLSPTPGTTQTDVEFTDPLGNIITAELTSTNNSFEVGNFSQTSSATPLPASLLMFGTGLAGLFFLARRRRATVKA